jgi:hypothetical protein
VLALLFEMIMSDVLQVHWFVTIKLTKKAHHQMLELEIQILKLLGQGCRTILLLGRVL